MHVYGLSFSLSPCVSVCVWFGAFERAFLNMDAVILRHTIKHFQDINEHTFTEKKRSEKTSCFTFIHHSVEFDACNLQLIDARPCKHSFWFSIHKTIAQSYILSHFCWSESVFFCSVLLNIAQYCTLEKWKLFGVHSWILTLKSLVLIHSLTLFLSGWRSSFLFFSFGSKFQFN